MSDLDKWLEKPENSSVPLTCKEICTIIKEASRCGVQQLDVGGVRLSFFESAQINHQQVSGIRPDVTNSSSEHRQSARQTRENANEQDLAEKAFLRQETLSVREQEVEQQLVHDPEKYEELISMGELSETEDNSGSE